jgi:F-type H+-transporting ATPase subunit gamma
MASLRDIKRRIKSIQSTQQITRAMKMISASKLRKSQARVQAVRPFARKIEDIILDVSRVAEHDFLQERKQVKKVCYLVIGSNRGFSGTFNGNLNRFLDRTLQEEQRPYSVVTVGSKVWGHCQHKKYPIDLHFTEIGDNPGYHQAQELAGIMRNAFSGHDYDEINLVYSEFKSVMTHMPRLKRLLPVQQPEENAEGSMMRGNNFIFEPSEHKILDVILPQYLDMEVYSVLQEAKASEHGARMTAMSSATDNAAEMLDDLTLSLNRSRQAAITKEISEIVGGAEALS